MNRGDLRFAAAVWSATRTVRHAAQDSLKSFGADKTIADVYKGAATPRWSSPWSQGLRGTRDMTQSVGENFTILFHWWFAGHSMFPEKAHHCFQHKCFYVSSSKTCAALERVPKRAPNRKDILDGLSPQNLLDVSSPSNFANTHR